MKDPNMDATTQRKNKSATPKMDEFGKPITKPAETLGTPKMAEESNAPDKPCPGSKSGSGGQGKGLGHGQGQGPVGRPKL